MQPTRASAPLHRALRLQVPATAAAASGCWFALLAFALLASHARAGGHLDVDDAGTLDPGRCQYEAWVGRLGAGGVRNVHLGPACRIGPFEVGLNIDHNAQDADREVVLGPQLKWMFLGDADATWSAAWSATVSSERRRGGRPGGQVLLPVTWHPQRNLWVHGNVGVDQSPGSGERARRHGLGVEWAVAPALSLLAERNRAFDAWTSRAGVRVALTPWVSIDATLSRTSGDGRRGVRGFVVGINHEFAAP